MIPELQPLLDVLTAKHGWLSAVLVWIGALRVICKWFSQRLQIAIEDRIAAVLASKSVADDYRVQRILDSTAYVWFAFAIDLLLSLKLPVEIGIPKPQTPGPFMNKKLPQCRLSVASVISCSILLLTSGCAHINQPHQHARCRQLWPEHYNAAGRLDMFREYTEVSAAEKWFQDHHGAFPR